MISIYYDTNNPYSIYGIEHFIKKTGIPVKINTPSDSGIIVTYGDVPIEGNFIIRVSENSIRNQICGAVSTSNETISLCEKPHDTGNVNNVISWFNDENSKYPCATRNGQIVSIGIDIFQEIGYILSGHYDALRSGMDIAHQRKFAAEPTADFLEKLLFDVIIENFAMIQRPLVQKSYWPNGKQFAVCLTHDVDEIKKTYQWLSRPLRYLKGGDLSGVRGQIYSFIQKIHGKEPYFTYEDIFRIENDAGVKSTYYILEETGTLKWSSKKSLFLYGRNRSFQYPEMIALIKSMQDQGDEVAIHGSFFSYIESGLLEQQKRKLEGITGSRILGSRQHNLNLKIPETWEYHISAGLCYDTSLGLHDAIGFRWGTSFPFYPNWKGSTIPLLEIPLIIMDICLESSKDKELECIRITDIVAKYHGALTVLWHPPVFNELEYPQFREIYIKIIRYAQENESWIAPAIEIYDWMISRDREQFSCLLNSDSCRIFPSGPSQYYTIFLPSESDCDSATVKNAEIITRAGRCLYIRTNDNLTAEAVIVEFS